MLKQFYQCDVAESDTDSIWTGPVVYGTQGEAEFETMLVLQQDWGDSYMPEGFLKDFGRSEEMNDPAYPGDDAWNAAGYFDEISWDSEVTTGMLQLDPVTALAKLDKIECHLTDEAIDAAVRGELKLQVIAG
jgi:hypothetical protein